MGRPHRHASGLLLPVMLVLMLAHAVAAVGAVVGVLVVRVGMEVAVRVAVRMGVGVGGWLLLDADDVVEDCALVVIGEGCSKGGACACAGACVRWVGSAP